MSNWRYGVNNEFSLVELIESRKLFSGAATVPGSGNQAHSKEDLSCDIVLIQVKSTRASSYSPKKLDLKKLEYHSKLVGKVPVFLISFTKFSSNKFLLSEEDFLELRDYITSDCFRGWWNLLLTSKISWEDSRVEVRLGNKKYKVLSIEDFT